jgi:uncharacterized membrane protein required for colicin V production
MILDIVIIALIVLGAFSGYKKGLVGVLVSFVGIILSIFLAFVLQAPLANYLENETSVGKNINQTIQESLNKQLNVNNDNENTAINSNENVYNMTLKMLTNNNEQGLTVEQSSKLITSFILKGISFITVFIIVFVICYILQMALNIVFELPILSSVNKLGGLGIGALKAFIKIIIILAIISFASPLPVFNDLVKIIQNSTICNLIYTNNIIVNIIKSNIKI